MFELVGLSSNLFQTPFHTDTCSACCWYAFLLVGYHDRFDFAEVGCEVHNWLSEVFCLMRRHGLRHRLPAGSMQSLKDALKFNTLWDRQAHEITQIQSPGNDDREKGMGAIQVDKGRLLLLHDCD